MKSKIIFILTIVFFSSCAVSRKVDYEGVRGDLPEFKQHTALACWDQREQILSGARKTDFVGYMRSGVGIAYPMGTESGRPLADIMANDIAESLKAKGSSSTVVLTQSSDKQSLILDKLKKTKNNRLILVNCKDFYTDGYGAVSLMYKLEFLIYSADGSIITQKTFDGKKPLGGSAAWGPGKFKEYIPKAFKALMEEIFSDPEIKRAILN